jgi:hypothetical protein
MRRLHMIIDKKYRIERAVSTDPERDNLKNVFVSQRHARATNGKLLAIVPITSEKDDTPGWMTPEALKQARKSSSAGLESLRIELNGAQALPDGTILERPDTGHPPKIFRLLRQAHSGRVFKIGLNAAYLRTLSDALGSEELILECGLPNQAVLVRAVHESNGAIGLIMPVRI